MRMLALVLAGLALACSDADAPDADASATDVDAATDAAPTDAPTGDEPAPPSCAAGAKTGADGVAFVADGVNVFVRTPPAYDPTLGAPFVMVYSPCCGTAAQLEQFTGLTAPARAHGYLVAYADHIAGAPLATIENAATIIPAVTDRFCVDPKRIYVAGHSDGASITEVVGALSLANVAAIAPSAAGFALSGAKQVGCRKQPLPVMEMHSSGDTVFPISQGYGADVAAWWAQCDGCDPTPTAPDGDGCVHYTGCASNVEVRYCQGTAVHGDWPGLDEPIFDFFDRFRAP